jgi:hypothetical protein
MEFFFLSRLKRRLFYVTDCNTLRYVIGIIFNAVLVISLMTPWFNFKTVLFYFRNIYSPGVRMHPLASPCPVAAYVKFKLSF